MDVATYSFHLHVTFPLQSLLDGPDNRIHTDHVAAGRHDAFHVCGYDGWPFLLSSRVSLNVLHYLQLYLRLLFAVFPTVAQEFSRTSIHFQGWNLGRHFGVL